MTQVLCAAPVALAAAGDQTLYNGRTCRFYSAVAAPLPDGVTDVVTRFVFHETTNDSQPLVFGWDAAYPTEGGVHCSPVYSQYGPFMNFRNLYQIPSSTTAPAWDPQGGHQAVDIDISTTDADMAGTGLPADYSYAGVLPRTGSVPLDGFVHLTSDDTISNLSVVKAERRYTGPLAITRIAPATGPATGGTPVTITGTSFRNGLLSSGDAAPVTTVLFGATPAANVTVLSDTSITCTAPAGSGGVQVTVGWEDPASGPVRSDTPYLYLYTSPTPPPPPPPVTVPPALTARVRGQRVHFARIR